MHPTAMPSAEPAEAARWTTPSWAWGAERPGQGAGERGDDGALVALLRARTRVGEAQPPGESLYGAAEANASDVADQIAQARGGEHGDAHCRAQRAVDAVPRHQHDGVVQEAEANEGNAAAEGHVDKLAVGGARHGRGRTTGAGADRALESSSAGGDPALELCGGRAGGAGSGRVNVATLWRRGHAIWPPQLVHPKSMLQAPTVVSFAHGARCMRTRERNLAVGVGVRRRKGTLRRFRAHTRKRCPVHGLNPGWAQRLRQLHKQRGLAVGSRRKLDNSITGRALGPRVTAAHGAAQKAPYGTLGRACDRDNTHRSSLEGQQERLDD